MQYNVSSKQNSSWIQFIMFLVLVILSGLFFKELYNRQNFREALRCCWNVKGIYWMLNDHSDHRILILIPNHTCRLNLSSSGEGLHNFSLEILLFNFSVSLEPILITSFWHLCMDYVHLVWFIYFFSSCLLSIEISIRSHLRCWLNGDLYVKTWYREYRDEDLLYRGASMWFLFLIFTFQSDNFVFDCLIVFLENKITFISLYPINWLLKWMFFGINIHYIKKSVVVGWPAA